MRVSEIVLRILLQFALVAVALILATALSQSSAAGMVLVYPVFILVPDIVLTLAVFAPIEMFGIRRDTRGLALAAIPLVAAASPLLLFPFAASAQEFATVAPMSSLAAFAWGLLWVITRPIYFAWKGE